ncbi:Dyp-type peroxidase [Gloeothece verrucosa]|uniref:Dyp-type peroxidase family n=1 Tax=Gloeothece verrucosa (strain PCC 7822) TaxID=497965 RepID=E0UMX0_GLOV7|nr:peroxidase [Gloeothece verrucosa]ADN18300.1 Dyp-type peroxidase family [Gloeothece verrucosa PCC 7822]
MTNNATSKELNLADIQGLIVRGYNMNVVRYFVLSVNDATKAKEFIGDLIKGESLKITSAEQWNIKPSHCLNIGFTFEGLKALKLQDNVNEGFGESENYEPFIKGAIAQAPGIGDTGESDPKNWRNGLDKQDKVHILLFLFAEDQDTLSQKSVELRDKFKKQEIQELGYFDGAKLLDDDGKPSDMIHFGYRDGIAQPRVEGFPAKDGIPDDGQPVIPAYEFVLMDEPQAQYFVPEPHILGKNSSFAAFRVLEQNVAAFEKFLQDQKKDIDPEILAAKMCGRWRNGVPLDLSPEKDQLEPPITYAQFNSFDYKDDQDGLKCPIGSHIRRNNPRNTLKAIGKPDSRRLIRRGIPYGPPYDPQSADEERGLLGLFICASLGQQFEFVMEDWVNSGSFAHLGDNVKDPLLGANNPQDSKFDIPLSPPSAEKSLEIKGFERFIITRGGAYCFLPSITALKYMAEIPST